ncbi:MAG: sialate O-acetylesterase [Acidobacteriaceae bacterium]
MNFRLARFHRLLLPAALLAFAVSPACAQDLGSTGILSSHSAQPGIHPAPSGLYTTQTTPVQTVSVPYTLRLPNILSNNAVLQRGRPIHIWGWSSPNESITVTFHSQTEQTTADSQGNWELWLAPEPAGGPYTLTVTGSKNEPPITLTNVLVGDVWFASGQSNMKDPLKGFNSFYIIKNSAQEIANSNHPNIHLLLIPNTASDTPANNVNATWTTCDPTTSPMFSAVAYLFARDLEAHLHIPIGIIDSAWGGTPISSWMSDSLLTSHPDFQPVHTKWKAYQASLPQVSVLGGQQSTKPKKRGWQPDPSSWHPSWLWNGMVAPVTPYTIRGFIWYQGETDSSDRWNPHLYKQLFPAMIQNWRAHWNEGRLPFLYVQISSFDAPKEHWGVIRNAQRTTLDLRGTGMAVSSDVGEPHNIHPADKQTVAQRLALTAFHISYGEQIEDEGPLFEQVIPQGAQLRIYFTHTAQGLVSKGGPLKGFEIEDGSGKWHYVNAVIQGNTVVVDTTSFPQTPAVRYAWANYTTANLYNGVGLPASTFEAQVP